MPPRMTDDDLPQDPRTPQRFATRVSGEEWQASIKNVSDPVRIVKVSRIGLELDTIAPLTAGGRYSIRLAHAGEITDTVFYVLRCAQIDGAPTPNFRSAGLFVETLSRKDLPEVIPDKHPK